VKRDKPEHEKEEHLAVKKTQGETSLAWHSFQLIAHQYQE
jgi:hypothetical protein